MPSATTAGGSILSDTTSPSSPSRAFGPNGTSINVINPNGISVINPNGISVIDTPNGGLSSDPIGESSARPPLPPPPRHCIHGRPMTASSDEPNRDAIPSVPAARPWWKSWNRKYVLLCATCGISCVLLGTFYLVIFFVLRSYTSSLEFFQTMPTYIPAILLIITGLMILCFIRRKNRFSVFIKIVGVLCLVCAVVCVVVTVTTTVLHMNRLQTLRECTFYTQLHSCTCLPFTDEEPFELKLDMSITTCDVIHGPLYSCLRAMFGVSVIGILVSIFSCMLVYQLLSHEKKKMYWEQLENRRRLLYSRNHSAIGANCNCCDEYGFVPSSEIYPWRMWDTVDDRYWNGGTQLYSPNGEDSSNASRSVLLGGTNLNGGPSLWLPWGGAMGASTGYQQQGGGQLRDITSPTESVVTQVDRESFQSGENGRTQSTGVLLRPFLPRGLEARFGLRRQPPPPPGSRRPLSDPGVPLQLPRYPFSDAYLPQLPYEGLDAFSRLMWDPPPPYSQPTDTQLMSPMISPPPPNQHRAFHHASPVRRPTTLADLMEGSISGGLSSPSDAPSINNSPAHFALTKDGTPALVCGTGRSLPLNHPYGQFGHVKSLGDVNQEAQVLFCDGKNISSDSKILPLHKFPSHDGMTHKLLSLKSRHLKSQGSEQESELYFADVSSCVSLRADGEETLYYSEPASHQTPTKDNNKEGGISCYHLYEQVKENKGDEEEEELDSHHTSDDTMIVHTSSSDQSLGVDTCSIVSPLTDQSSASPMVTDTDAYSCYQAVVIPSSEEENSNLNLQHHRKRRCLEQQAPPPCFRSTNYHHRKNDNESSSAAESEPRYEMIPAQTAKRENLTGEFVAASDLNGNLPSAQRREMPVVRQAQRTNLSLPLGRVQSTDLGRGVQGTDHGMVQTVDHGKVKSTDLDGGQTSNLGKVQSTDVGKVQPTDPRRKSANSKDKTPERKENSSHKKLESNKARKKKIHIPSSEPPSTSTDRRLQSVQDHLFNLKSVNV